MSHTLQLITHHQSGVPPPLQHGTCVGGKLTRSKTLYYGTGLEYVKKFTKAGTAAQKAFSANAGKNVTLEYLNAAYSAPLINQVRPGFRTHYPHFSPQCR